MPQSADNQNDSVHYSGDNHSFPAMVSNSPRAKSPADKPAPLSQQELDRLKAEELIASLSDLPSDEATIISCAPPSATQPDQNASQIFDEQDTKPGEFAEKDPYVDENDSQSPGSPDAASSLRAGKHEQKKMPEVPQNQPNSLANNSQNLVHTHNDSPELSANSGARTVEDILALLPDYEETKETSSKDLKPTSQPSSEVTPKEPAKAGVKKPIVDLIDSTQPNQQATDSATVAAETADIVVSQSTAETVKPADTPTETIENYTPVTWFSNSGEETNKATTPPAPTTVPGTTQDPFSGEEVFDIGDFSELAEKPILPIPGGLKSDPVATPSAPGNAPVEPANPPKTAASPLNIVIPSPASKQPEIETSKIDDEISAAIAAADSIAEPVCDDRPVSFSEETFDAAPSFSAEQQNEEKIFAPQAVSSTDASFSESWDSNADDELFLAGEGDVIEIDGNDGYDFIDLACFDRSAAKISGNLILVTEESGSTFQVKYRNISYVEFADNVRVDLPPA